MEHFDVIVFGAGIVGCSIAWRLARTSLRTALIEKGSDVANGATRANSGILHSGIHEKPGSEVYKMCRQGLAWYRKWADPLDFKLENKPTVILADSPANLLKINHLQKAHKKNLTARMVNSNEIMHRWPFLAQSITGAIEVSDSAQISPYETCRAIAENATANGLHFFTDCSLENAQSSGANWLLKTSKGSFSTNCIIIACGAGSNELSLKLDLPANQQKLLSGAYFMLNKSAKPATNAIFFGPAGPETKGILIQNTVHGNLMLGPDSIDISELKYDRINWERICCLWQNCLKLVPCLDKKDIIRTFSGERVCTGKGFQINNHLADLGIIRLDGIKSPGLTAAPAIADKVLKLIANKFDITERSCLNEYRFSINTSVSNKPRGEIICRCEKVFVNQIREAINRGAESIESLRWQTRAAMGDCQGSFCRPTLIRALQKELGLKPNEIRLKNKNSAMFSDNLK